MKKKVDRKSYMKLLLLITTIVLLTLNISAKRRRPLAPPSPIALSAKEMILHFKLFIIIDIYRNLTLKTQTDNTFFQFTDIELNSFLQDKIYESAILSNTDNLESYIHNQKLFIKIENNYFTCSQIEVLPGQYDYQIIPVNKAIYNENKR